MGLHDGHRQRKRQQFLSHGPQSMADHELLELALFYAIPRRDTNETAHRAVSFLFYRRFCGRGMPSTRAMPTASATAILKVEMPFASASALSP